MATGAAEGMMRCVFEGCLSGCDTGIERRPYHRYCGCALHKFGRKGSKGSRGGKNISYPMRRSWSEGSLVLAASGCCSPSSSPSSSPVVTLNNGRSHLILCNEQDEDEELKVINSLKV